MTMTILIYNVGRELRAATNPLEDLRLASRGENFRDNDSNSSISNPPPPARIYYYDCGSSRYRRSTRIHHPQHNSDKIFKAVGESLNQQHPQVSTMATLLKGC